jgi:hypothetical protein
MGGRHSVPKINFNNIINEIKSGADKAINFGENEYNSIAGRNKRNKNNNPCNYQLNVSEAACYLNRYPNLNQDYPNTREGAQSHWSSIGCKENRKYSCPSPQSTSANYTFQGCYNDQGNRAIPNQMQNVKSIDECRKLAENSNNNVFGMQYYGQCFVGNDKDSALKYNENVNKDNCNSMGGTWTNQVYFKDSPIKQYVPIPKLTSQNFNNDNNNNNNNNNNIKKQNIQQITEKFDNNNNINEVEFGTNNLYNEIFCNIEPLNNGFKTCSDCEFTGQMTILNSSNVNNENECLSSCKNNKKCTSYTYDTSSDIKNKNTSKNCITYNTFPNIIKKNIVNKNSGINMTFPYDYMSLTESKKKNIKKHCINNYLNHTYNTDNNYLPCIDKTDNNQSTQESKINIDAECIYKLYEKKGIKNEKKIFKYKDTQKFNNSQRDPIIDNYKTSYDSYYMLQEESEKINEELGINDDNLYDNYNTELEGSFNESINNIEENHNNEVNNVLKRINGKSLIESAENFQNLDKYVNIKNKENNSFYLFMIIIIIIIFIIYILLILKK